MENYVNKGLYYSDSDFKLDCLKFYHRINAGAMPPPSDFKASRHFIQSFRYRHRMRLRRPSLKRRRVASREEIDQFVARVQSLIEQYPAERILNIDETNWRAVAAGFLTWAKAGTESVQCQIDNDEKQGVTAIAAIDFAGNKLPLTIIGKGKTERCLKGYDLPPEVWTSTSETGWTTSDVMCWYFACLREREFPEGPIILLLDCYSAHRCNLVRAAAQQWGIELVFIPPGCTNLLQPLDRHVFGVLKAHARKLWRVQYHSSHGGKTTRPMMAGNLVEAWKRITPEVIESAWDCYEVNWSEDLSDQSPPGSSDDEYQP
jgi:hypothetical protein